MCASIHSFPSRWTELVLSALFFLYIFLHLAHCTLHTNYIDLHQSRPVRKTSVLSNIYRTRKSLPLCLVISNSYLKYIPSYVPNRFNILWNSSWEYAARFRECIYLYMKQQPTKQKINKVLLFSDSLLILFSFTSTVPRKDTRVGWMACPPWASNRIGMFLCTTRSAYIIYVSREN
jgi:hypothetical protein